MGHERNRLLSVIDADTDIKPLARILLRRIYLLSEKKGYCFARNKVLAGLIGCTKSTGIFYTSQLLTYLELKGRLTITKIKLETGKVQRRLEPHIMEKENEMPNSPQEIKLPAFRGSPDVELSIMIAESWSRYYKYCYNIPYYLKNGDEVSFITATKNFRKFFCLEDTTGTRPSKITDDVLGMEIDVVLGVDLGRLGDYKREHVSYLFKCLYQEIEDTPHKGSGWTPTINGHLVRTKLWNTLLPNYYKKNELQKFLPSTVIERLYTPKQQEIKKVRLERRERRNNNST